MKVAWSEIEEGDVVQSAKNGLAYQVVRAVNGQYSLDRQGQILVLKTPKGQVERLLSVRAVAEQAIAQVQVRLGGTFHAVKDDDGVWQVPVEYAHPGELRAHVYVLHGRRLADGDYLPDLLAEHAKLHAPAQKELGWVPHHHTPDFMSVARQEVRTDT